MRDILFRGKRVDNGEWIYGYAFKQDPPLVCFSTDTIEQPKWFITYTGFADWGMPRPMEAVEVIPDSISQYTGLKDKNGKKIFEGDIVAKCWYDDHIKTYIVAYDETIAAFIGESIDKLGFTTFDTDTGSWNIIGNICDNPEMLTKATSEDIGNATNDTLQSAT